MKTLASIILALFAIFASLGFLLTGLCAVNGTYRHDEIPIALAFGVGYGVAAAASIWGIVKLNRKKLNRKPDNPPEP